MAGGSEADAAAEPEALKDSPDRLGNRLSPSQNPRLGNPWFMERATDRGQDDLRSAPEQGLRLGCGPLGIVMGQWRQRQSGSTALCRTPAANRLCDLLAFKQSLLKIDGATLAKLCGSPDWKRAHIPFSAGQSPAAGQPTPASSRQFSILSSGTELHLSSSRCFRCRCLSASLAEILRTTVATTDQSSPRDQAVMAADYRYSSGVLRR